MQEQHEAKTSPDPTTPRPRRRARLAAVALAAGALSVALTGCGDDEESGSEPAASGQSQTTPTGADASPPPTPPAGVQVNIASRQAGEEKMSRTLRGAVSISDTGCIHVQPRGKDAEAVDVLWPAGYELVQVGTNPMEIRNGEGEPVARIGTTVTVHGGEAAAGAAAQVTCEATEDGAVFEITDELEPLPGS